MEMTEILDRAKKQLAATTGLKPVAITRAFEDEEGWHVGVAMLEMSRIPTSSDVLGDYEVLLNDCGDLLRFERRRSRLRCETGEESEGVILHGASLAGGQSTRIRGAQGP